MLEGSRMIEWEQVPSVLTFDDQVASGRITHLTHDDCVETVFIYFILHLCSLGIIYFQGVKFSRYLS